MIIRGTDKFCGFCFSTLSCILLCCTFNQIWLCILLSSYVKIQFNQTECTKWMSVLPGFWLYFHWKWLVLRIVISLFPFYFIYNHILFDSLFSIQPVWGCSNSCKYVVYKHHWLLFCYWIDTAGHWFLIQSPKKRKDTEQFVRSGLLVRRPSPITLYWIIMIGWIWFNE